MQKKVGYVIALLLMSTPLFAQGRRLWVLQSSGEMVEYDPTTFAPKQHVKLSPEALKSPSNIALNRQGQILFAPTVSLPLSDADAKDPHKIWIWNGHTATSIDQAVEHKSEEHGSNQAVTESAPFPYLSADGNHLFWFANQQRRLQREEVDLSTTVTFQAWRTDMEGKAREEMTSTKLPDCRCPTGSCDESCPSVSVWAPDDGIQNFFLTTQVVAGQTATTYKESTRYQLEGSKWTANAFSPPLQRALEDRKSTVRIKL